jgi:DtxR family Mn-dependent transcriptional regulator
MAASTPTATRCGCTDPEDCVDRRVGRYLTAVHWLAGRGRVRTGAVSDRLGVTPATVTEMFERLADAGLVDYEKRAGVTPTDRGAAVARELAWRQCVVRTFAERVLGVDVGAGDGYRFGYVLPTGGVEELRALVDDREDCCEHETASDRACLFGPAAE